MGMYTDFCFDADLREDTPQEVIEILLNWRWDHKELPKHPLFDCPRWTLIGYCCSAYFPAAPHFKIIKDDWSRNWTLNIRCNLKNYDSEIENFIDWIMPYVADYNEFLGFYRYEEDSEPTLIYKDSK